MVDSLDFYDLIDPAFLSESNPASPVPWDFPQTSTDDNALFNIGQYGAASHSNLDEFEQGVQPLEGSSSVPTSLTHEALTALSASSSAVPTNSQDHEPGAKTSADQSSSGNRFTSSALRILRTWFTKHDEHPYPSARQIETLQAQTGLTKKQITNWFANARRRYRTQPKRYSSPFLKDSTTTPDIATSAEATPVEVPPRRPTPAPFGSMDPLQRWQNSPPEDEAAALNDISRALDTSGELVTSHRSRSAASSGNASSVDSGGTSRSSRSRGYWSDSSAFSQAFNKDAQTENRQKLKARRRRHPTSQRNYRNRLNLIEKLHTFQCTFCAETFKSKYDWQRHEKSLHVSFEEWICSPNGSVVPGEKGMMCAYCGEQDPDAAHLDQHHDVECSQRPLKDRTFYRKDHLRQHLKLVHDCKYLEPIMQGWQTTKQDIKSKCGFCGVDIATWPDRVNHLAAHFKSGSTMADWKGNWGFEPHINAMIENSMPPYLIHLDQNSPLPFTVVSGPVSPTSAYELLKLELEFYMQNYFEVNGCLPSDQESQLEGCCVIFGADFKAHVLPSTSPSWIRDVLMSSADISNEAYMRPTNRSTRARFTQLVINGKASIFERCSLELRLRRFLSIHNTMGVAVSDRQIQEEAANIAVLADSAWHNSSKRFVDFLVRLIWSSTDWIAQVRERAQQEPVENVADNDGQLGMVMSVNSAFASPAVFGAAIPPGSPLRGDAPASLDQTIALTNYSLISPGLPGANQNPLSTPEPGLKLENPQANMVSWNRPINASMLTTGSISQGNILQMSSNTGKMSLSLEHSSGLNHPAGKQTYPVTSSFLAGGPAGDQQDSRDQVQLHNSCNCYWALRRELFRYVIRTMSPNNPNCHVPSDDELRYQARWIWCEDDDPWEHTPADSEEWLRDFKRDAGILVDVPGEVVVQRS